MSWIEARRTLADEKETRSCKDATG